MSGMSEGFLPNRMMRSCVIVMGLVLSSCGASSEEKTSTDKTSTEEFSGSDCYKGADSLQQKMSSADSCKQSSDLQGDTVA